MRINANIYSQKKAWGGQAATKYLDVIKREIGRIKPRIIYLFNHTKQLTASIALANCAKLINPDCITVMGGLGCRRPMAEAILNISLSIDYIFTNEPESEFPAFSRAL